MLCKSRFLVCIFLQQEYLISFFIRIVSGKSVTVNMGKESNMKLIIMEAEVLIFFARSFSQLNGGMSVCVTLADGASCFKL